MINIMGLLLQSVVPAGLVIWMAFFVRRRLDTQEKRHLLEMERLVAVVRKMLPPGEETACTSDNCSGQTPDECAHYGDVANMSPVPLPVARALKS